VAALKPADILPLVAASFSLAASAFVPVMVLGIFWRGTTRAGAVAGRVAAARQVSRCGLRKLSTTAPHAHIDISSRSLLRLV